MERAANQAASALAFERAADLYQRTLALTAHPPALLEGDLDAAVEGYRDVAAGFEAVDMMQPALAARWRLGELLRGDAGRELIGQASAALLAEGIVRPDRVVTMFAPCRRTLGGSTATKSMM